MQVILMEKIANLGGLGEVVKVRDGFARNYLIPNGKAKRATPENVKEFEVRRVELERVQNEALAKAQEQGAKLDGVLKAKEAFGNPSMHPVKKIPRGEFPKDANLKTGEKFSAKGANGQDVVMVIEKVTDKEVDVALVHPLADKDIKYEVEVLSVKEVKAPPPIPVAALELEEAPE